QKRISQIENSLLDPSLNEINQFLRIFNCSFEELFENEERTAPLSRNLLIKYKHRGENHVDPNFNYLVYGDTGKRATRLKNIISKGSLVFFHTSIGSSDYITGYFQVDRILEKGKDDLEIHQIPCDAKIDEFIIIGDREESKILTSPLLLDKKLAMQLTSLGITEENFIDDTVSELSAITRATREHRELSPIDVKILKNKCIGRG
ncbi:TPA: helix-turn-helix domain-containing protein, partial [Bacillus cereus]